MREIFVLYYETRSLVLRNHLVELNIGLARIVAHRKKDNCNLDYEELFELATMGLIKAVERYNPLHKFFTSFALPYIKGEIQHFLRDKVSAVRVPRGLHEMSSKIKKARNHLSTKFGRHPSDTEVALYLGVSKNQISEAIKASENQRYIWSLDSKLDDTDLTLGDTLVGRDSLTDRTDEILGKLERAIASLNNPAIDLIYLQGKSLSDAQKLLKLTQAQIKTLLLQGIEELAKLDICDLDEAVRIAASHDDLQRFGSSVGFLLPSDSLAFLHDWLSEQLLVAA